MRPGLRPGKDGVMVLWYNSKGINTTGDGIMFAADFQVNDHAPDGNDTIGLGYAPESTLNQDGDTVAMQTSSGAITVTGGINGSSAEPAGPAWSSIREQLAAVLHRLAGSATGMECAFFDFYDQTFTDSANVSKWARASLYWAVYHEIYCGENSVSPEHTLAPSAAANRAQIAVMMVRYLQKYS